MYDGSEPFGGVTIYNGNLYGVSAAGGRNNFGTIWEITP